MELILIHETAIDNALKKARQYRAINEPEIATSICLDILAIEPVNQAALTIYILALTDCLGIDRIKTPDSLILSSIDQLESEYDRLYYSGIFKERKARALLGHSMSTSFAYQTFMEAIHYFQQANALSTDDNDDAILRHNSCVRTIQLKNLEPRLDPHHSYLEGEA